MLNVKNFIHPEDEAALRNLEAIPGLSTAVKLFLKYGYEKQFHGVNMASKIRLSSTQLPDIYNRLPPICQKLDIVEPEFYLEMNPMPNAYTFGDTQIFITVTSGLLEYLNDAEINSVIAHECGHILCRHVLYHSMATMILSGSDFLGALGNLILPLKYAFLYWQRKSELSADRAAALAMGIDSVVATQVRLAGGSETITGDINLEEWAKQADLYEDIRNRDTWNRTLQILAVMNNSHPFAAVRVREILRWGASEQYRLLREEQERGDSGVTCPNCRRQAGSGWSFCKYCGTKL
jgi:Zn-dependent protease with chaperone function